MVEEEELANDADVQDSDKSCCCWTTKRLSTVQGQVAGAFVANYFPYFSKMPLHLTKMMVLVLQ